MKKIFLIVIPVVALGWIAFIVYSFLSKDKIPVKELTAAEIAYDKQHRKEVGEAFIVDNISYTVTSFSYMPQPNATDLIVNIECNNKSGNAKYYDASFFNVKDEKGNLHNAFLNNFELQKAQKQNVQLKYILPERTLPYITSDLIINSLEDTAQNAFVKLFKNYRAQG